MGTESCEIEKLTAPGGEGFDWFGYAVAIHGDTVVVGSHLDDNNGPNTGSAHVFHRRGNAWEAEQEIVPPDPVFHEQFGIRVAITRDLLIVGSLWRGRGAAYVFRKTPTAWLHEVTLIATDGEDFDGFGICVAIESDLAVVGAFRTDDMGHDSGSAYVFRRQDHAWIQEQKLLATDGQAEDGFGFSVAIADGTVAVGSPRNFNASDTLNGVGSVYIFAYEKGHWIEVQKVVHPGFPGNAARILRKK